MSEFGVGKMIYRGDIYDRMNTFSFDLDFYKKWCAEIPGPVLELCSGTGRITIPLKNAGLDIMGLDGSDSMLETARKKAQKAHLEMEFVKGDMRSFDLGRRFSTVFIPFNSLQNTYSISDVAKVLGNVRKHLEPHGLFLFDVFNPDIHMMVEREKEPKVAFTFALEDGTKVVVRERCSYDAASQVNRVQWFFRIGEEETVEKLDMRCFFPLELEALLAYNGWEVLHMFGSFDEERFHSKSSKMIYVCRAKG